MICQWWTLDNICAWVVVAVRHTRPSKFSLCSSETALRHPWIVQWWPLQPRNYLCGPEGVFAVQRWARDGLHGPEAAVVAQRQPL